MNIQLTLAARYLSGRKLRTTLTTLAIVFGVLVVFGMNTLLPAFTRSFQANILAAVGQVDATLTLKTADAFDSGLAEKAASVAGVRAVSGFLNRTVNLPDSYFDGDPATPDAISAVSLVGIDPAQARTVHAYRLIEGRFLDVGDRAAAVISESLAEEAGVRAGGALRLPSASGETALAVVGILPARVLTGDEEVLVTLPQAQAMLAMPGKINTIEANFDTLDDARRLEIERNLLAALGDTFQLGSLSSNAELLDNLKIAQAIFNLLGVLALLMGGFIIFNTFRTVVAERRRDIGMLRALGAKRSTISGVIVFEGLVQGLAGTALGLALGYLLGIGMTRLVGPMMQQYLNVQVGSPVVTPWLVLGSAAMGIGVTLLAGLLPAVTASRVTPLEALRPSVGPLSLRRMAGLSFWSGVVFIVLAIAALFTRSTGLVGLGGALFILGLVLVAPALVNPIANLFGRLLALVFARDGTAQLAEGNLSRQPSRATITASTTMIGMAIVVMASAFIASAAIGFERVLRKSLGSDFLLVPPSIAVWGTNVGAQEQFANSLREVEGVSVVSTLRFAPTRLGETAVALIAIDPELYPQVSGLNFSRGKEAEAYARLAQGRNIIINPVLATAAGAGLGDPVELVTPTGRQTYRVVAIAGDYLNSKITTGYISHANLAADFNRREDVLLQINLDPQADPAAAEAALKAALAGYPQFRLISGQAYIDESLRLFQAAFAGLLALVVFLAVPSLIAMVNTLAIGVIERTREIGMLRAVGATRSQVRWIILAEALILAAIGTAFGVLSGLYLGYMGVEALRAAGFPLEYAFPASGVLMVVAAGLLFGVLAALIPARQAARLEIVQALRYE